MKSAQTRRTEFPDFPARRLLDDALRAKYGQGLDAEQLACLENAEQREECLDMLDDMQARLDIAADVVQAVIAELDGVQQ